MPYTYTQLYVHCVFAVKYRAAMLDEAWDERLRSYITAIVQNQGHKMLAINNVVDHLHLFVGLSPAQSVSDMMRDVKANHLYGSTRKDLFQVGLIGKMVTAPFHIQNHRFTRSFSTFIISASIIRR